jgi:hypothetical protein
MIGHFGVFMGEGLGGEAEKRLFLRAWLLYRCLFISTRTVTGVDLRVSGPAIVEVTVVVTTGSNRRLS